MLIKFRPFTVKFLLFLVSYSFVIAAAIYIKEFYRNHDVGFLNLLFWQLSIWLPWAFAPFAIERLSELIESQKKIIKFIFMGLFFIFLLSLHGSLFLVLSSNLSPLVGFEMTRYGVYSYFFIFWIMMDIILLWGLSVRLNVLDTVSDVPERPLCSPIAVKENGVTSLIQPKEVMWIAAENYYAAIQTKRGRFLIRKPLKVLLRDLSKDQFFQIHRSTIVNIAYVVKIIRKTDGNYSVLMEDKSIQQVSRSGLKLIKEALSGSKN